MMPLEKLNWLYYEEVKFLQNIPNLMKFFENMNFRCYQEVKFLQKVRQFCWCD